MSRLVPVEYVIGGRSVRTPPVLTTPTEFEQRFHSLARLRSRHLADALIHIAVKGQVHSWKSEKKAPKGLVRRRENRAYLTEPGMWSVVVDSGEQLRVFHRPAYV